MAGEGIGHEGMKGREGDEKRRNRKVGEGRERVDVGEVGEGGGGVGREWSLSVNKAPHLLQCTPVTVQLQFVNTQGSYHDLHEPTAPTQKVHEYLEEAARIS